MSLRTTYVSSWQATKDWVVPAGLEERRFLVLDVSDRHMQDYPYFKAIGQQMDNGGREAMLHDLLARDIKDVNLSIYPRTPALLDQILSSMSPIGEIHLRAATEQNAREVRQRLGSSSDREHVRWISGLLQIPRREI